MPSFFAAPTHSNARPVTPQGTGRLLQRACACGQHTGGGGECEGCKKKRMGLQRAAVNAVSQGAGPHPALPRSRTPFAGEGEAPGRSAPVATTTGAAAPGAAPPIVHEVLRGPGQPLDQGARAFMEPRFGQDFSRVRVHTGARAAASARAVSANAYTVGSDIVFGAARYAPQTAAGRRLLAHELAHVVQQSGQSGPLERISSPSEPAERQAERVGAQIGSQAAVEVSSQPAPAAGLMRDIVSANPSPSGGGGRPPADMTGCHVILGGRRIDHWLAGTLGFRHLYINMYEGPSNYALIEGGPVGSSTGGTSGAWVKNGDWDARGVQWDITPQNDCPGFIACLKRETATYHAAGHPYHYSQGPNSNSFAWWVLNQCGTTISPLVASYPYLGVDYWQTHSAAPAPAAASAGP